MFFKEKVEKRYNDFDTEGNILPWKILEYFENVANNQLLIVEKGLNDGLVWIMTEWRIEIERYPRIEDELFATTWAIDDGATLVTKRAFTLTDEEGKVLVRGCGSYILFNLETQRIARISDERIKIYQAEKQLVFEDELPKHRTISEFDSEMPIFIRKSDIDSNKHVHNTNYLEFGLEAYEGSYNEIKFIRITYKAQVVYGDNVVIRTKIEAGEQNSSIIIGEKIHTIITIQKK